MGGDNRARNGASLIEAMVACLVLACLAVGAAALFARSQADVATQRNKRAVLEAVQGRMEELRRCAYADLAPPTQDYAVHYLAGAPGSWTHQATDPNEGCVANGLTLPVTTTVQYRDVDTSDATDTYDYLHVTIRAAYRLATPDDRVLLDTFIAPHPE
jgi:type II secretory pathway pseudopilin PulG